MQTTPRILTTLVLPALLTACGNPQDVDMSDQLEPITFTLSGLDVEVPGAGASFTGAATVTGSERDFSVAISTDEGELVVDLHSPGQSDLSGLDGQELTLSVPGDEYEWGGDGLLVLSDSAGPAWVANLAGSPGTAADDLFGEGWVRFGERRGDEDVANFPEDPSETDHHVFYSVIVQTDDGELELLPGDAAHVSLDGQDWRFVLVAAYKIDDGGWFGTKCMSAPDVLSFELVRVDAPGEDLIISRPEGVDPVFVHGC